MSQQRKVGQEAIPRPAPSSDASSVLRKDEARFRRVFDASPIGVAVMTERGQFVHANSAFCELIRYSLPELRSFPDGYLMHPDDRASARASITPLWDGTVSNVRFETRMIDKAGQIHWVDFTASLMVEGRNGVGHALVHIQDVTRHKQYIAERERLLRRMVRAQAMFQGVVRSVPDGVIIADPSGAITMVNTQTEDMFDYTFEELVGHPIHDLIPAINLPGLSRNQRSSTGSAVTPNSGKGRQLLVGIRKDGTGIEIEVERRPLVVEGNQHTITSVRDVTAFRRGERRSLVMSHIMERLAESFEDDVIGFVVIEALVPDIADFVMLQTLSEGGTVDRVVVAHRNPEGLHLLQELGRRIRNMPDAQHEAAGLGLVSTLAYEPVVTPDRLPALAFDDQHLAILRGLDMRSFIRVPLEARDREVGRLVLGMTDSGRHFDQDDFDFACNLAGRMALEVDNFRLYTAERAQREAAESLVAGRDVTLANIADGVIVANRRGEIGLVNAAARTMLGMSATDDTAVSDIQYPTLHGPDGATENILELLRKAVLQSDSMTIEREVSLPGDVKRTLEMVFSPLPVNGSPDPGIILLIRDVSAMRALERAKDDFLANITHDLRSPLTAIKHSIGVILANVPGDLPEPLHRMLINSEAATIRMQVMVENLLDVAQMQEGRIKRIPVPVDLRTIVNRAADVVEPLIEVRKQRLVRMVCSDPLVVMADAVNLDRSLTNLLDNAHKYGQEGGSIWISLFEDRGRAVIRVEDDGPGIDPADRVRIFRRFVRNRYGIGATVPGTGLGLPIAKTLVEIEGGELQFESSLGVGTAFSIVLPIPDGESPIMDPAESDTL